MSESIPPRANKVSSKQLYTLTEVPGISYFYIALFGKLIFKINKQNFICGVLYDVLHVDMV